MKLTSHKFNGPIGETDRERAQAERNCSGATCTTGLCSPCLIVWGLVVLLVVINLLLETFR